MKKIGLTGGIGSGKSTIARIFKQMGYPVYIADSQAARLMNTHPDIRKDLIAHFGPQVYTPQGYVNKAVVADLIFNNTKALSRINRIVHPRVMEDFEQWSKRQKNDFVFFESAILFEAGLAPYFEHIICVTAPEHIRLKRVVSRDHTSIEKVKERITNQLDDSIKCKQSDFIIQNDDEHMVIGQVMKIIQDLKDNR